MKISLQETNYKFKVEVKYIREYLSFNEKEIKNRHSFYQKKFYEDLMEFPRMDIMQHLYEEELKKLPSYFYHSSFILIFSIVEGTLKELCSEMAIKLSLPIRVDELHGTNLTFKSVAFLKKFCGIDFKEIEKELAEIKRYQRIRNLIVHNSSQVASKDDDLKLMKGIKVDNYGSFFISSVKPLLKFLDVIANIVVYIIAVVEEGNYCPLCGEGDERYRNS